MKKILVSGIVLLSVFIIYLANMDREVYYLALGDSAKIIADENENKAYGYSFYVQKHLKTKGVLEKYVYEYSKSDKRITDLINDIKSNDKIKSITLKNALIKADLVTLSIRADDVFAKLKDNETFYNEIYDYIDDLTSDLEKLFKLMREYCKEDIVFIGYYNPYKSMNNSDIDDVVDYLNKRYKEICKEYDVEFVDISGMDVSRNMQNDDIRLNSSGCKYIGDKVIEVSDKILFGT